MAGLGPDQLQRLRAFLVDCGEHVSGKLRSRLIVGGRSNLTFRIDDERSSWVARRPPDSGLTPSAHDMGREFRVGSALQGSAVPVARTVGYTDDVDVIGAPFSVVEYVRGRTIQSSADLDGWSDAELTGCAYALIDTLVGLHRVDFVAAGLGDFGRTQGYGARQLRRWSGQWEHMEADNPLADKLLRLLEQSVPEQGSCSLVHGDFRVDNTILDEDDIGQVLAVVDWELSTLGDPVADVAMMCAYRHPALDAVLGFSAAWTSDRFPDADALCSTYESHSGSSLEWWDFYLALGYYKLAVIAEGITYRYRRGATTDEGFDMAGDAVPQFLEAGLQVVDGRG